MDKHTHRPTLRVLEILESLASAKEGLTLAQIAKTIKAPKSSLFPFVHTLLQRHYLETDPETGRYKIGLSASAVAASYSETHTLLKLALREMQHVVDECTEVCQLGVLDGAQVLYIGKVDSPEAIRLTSYVGKRLPANCTAIGKALLCGHSEEQLRCLYNNALPGITASSIRDFTVLAAQAEAIRAGTFAIDIAEAHEHIRCYALPLSFRGTVDSAISVSTPIFRYTDEKSLLIRTALLKAQNTIQRMMEELNEGFRPLPPKKA